MSFAEILFLGFVQGLTEFLPVSSSGHLVLFQQLMGIREPQVFIDLMLHVGTLLSLLVFLRRDIIGLIRSFFGLFARSRRTAEDPYRKWLFFLVSASIPTFLMGYFFSGFFESLFDSLRTVGLALVGTGIFIWLTRFSRPHARPKLSHSLLIGIFQGAAIIPGLSRSGLTIGSALLMGWPREEATRFSFMLSVPVIFGASVFQMSRIDLADQSWALIGIGLLTAAAVGWGALVFLSALVKKGKFHVFAYYCLPVGLAALVASFLIRT